MPRLKQQLNIHAKEYIRAVFEERLIAEGFKCPDDNLLCWYRIHNQELLNSIVFYTPWANLPLMLNIGYGIFPLFSSPVYTKSVHFSGRPFEDYERFLEQPIVENRPLSEMTYCRYSEDIAVDAPVGNGRGVFTFDEIILPEMTQIGTVRGAYDHHKCRRQVRSHHFGENNLCTISATFADMAIFVGDHEVYSACIERADAAISIYEKLGKKTSKVRDYTKELQQWQQIRATLFSKKRDDYLAVLEQRKEANIQSIKKALGNY